MISSLSYRLHEPARSYRNHPKIPEEQIIRIWLREAIPGKTILTINGDQITIIEPGTRNLYDGPDFINTRILVRGEIQSGNTEVHSTEGDWFRHRHNTDPRYKDLLLHVVLYRTDYPTRFLARYTVVLTEILSQPLREVWDIAIREQSGEKLLPCKSHVTKFSRQTIGEAVNRAASTRFARKTSIIKSRLEIEKNEESLSAPNRQVFYELFARALGYGGNKETMESLARILPLEWLPTISRNEAPFRFVLLARASGFQVFPNSVFPGLKPETLADLSRRAEDILPQGSMIPIQAWMSRCVRPGNRVLPRIAYLAVFIPSLLSNTWRQSLENALRNADRSRFHSYDALFPFFSPSDHRYGGIRPGKERLREILTNVIAPCFAALAELRRDSDLLRAAAALFHRQFPAPENSITRKIGPALGFRVPFSSSVQQGLIEIQTQFCERHRCSDCPLGRSDVAN